MKRRSNASKTTRSDVHETGKPTMERAFLPLLPELTVSRYRRGFECVSELCLEAKVLRLLYLGCPLDGVLGHKHRGVLSPRIYSRRAVSGN